MSTTPATASTRTPSIILVDTNLLLRFFSPQHPDHDLVSTAIAVLEREIGPCCVVPQIVYEYWAVATRPRDVNGLGRAPDEASQDLDRISALFNVLPDDERLFPAWRALVSTYKVSGKSSHDARLAAAADVHGVRHLLTFNTPDFRRFDRLTLHDPREVAAA